MRLTQRIFYNSFPLHQRIFLHGIMDNSRQNEDYGIGGKKLVEKLERNPTYLKLINARAFWASGVIKSLRMVFFMNFLTEFLEKFKFNDCTDIIRH